MIIELRKYNEIGVLLIETEKPGSQGKVCYWDGGQRISMTTVAVHMRSNGMEAQT